MNEDLAVLKRVIHERVILLGERVGFDFKELLTQARWVEMAGRQLWALIRPFNPDVLIGPGFGGIPLLYAVALAARQADGVDLAIWMVRDQRKTYYRKKWIEGPVLPSTSRAVIVDDFLGKGSGIDLVDQALEAEDRQVKLCAVAVLFDNWNPLGTRQLSVSRFPVVSVFKRHDFGLSRDCYDANPPLMKGAAPPMVTEPLWWRFDLNAETTYPFKSTPLIADGAIFVADDSSRVWRLDAASGEPVWCYRSLEQPYKGIVQRLQCIDGSLIFACYDGTLAKLDALTGEVQWRWKLDAHIHATPVVDLPRQRIFINTEQSNNGDPTGHLVALDWHTGRTIWRRSQAFWPPGTPAFFEPTDAVVAPCNDQTLVCVGATSGEPRWNVSTQGLVRGMPVVDDTGVIVATEAGVLQRFDLTTGELTHSRSYGTGLTQQVPHLSDGLVYVLDNSAGLGVFSASDLQLRWLGRLRSTGACSAVAFNGYLTILSREGHLAVFEPARERKVWEGQIGGTYHQAPAVGRVGTKMLLACASLQSGLKVFQIDQYYDPRPL